MKTIRSILIEPLTLFHILKEQQEKKVKKRKRLYAAFGA